MPDAEERTQRFRQTIATFINERRDTKLKGLDAEAATLTAGKYDYATWLADAARRVAQIQAVTHVLKATHPDARGSSLYIDPRALPSRSEIGSHLLGKHYETDIVGNAAALDVYKFLKLEVEGRRLLDWLEADDGDLLAALHEDPDTASQWAAAFKGLTRAGETLASHSLAKQVYWCVSGEPADDSGYHLLQPLFSSSLAHAVHQEINDARFGEASKEVRQARRDKKSHEGVYRDYRNLVVRKLGGTKPQNISQLNSERGGLNYLLASLPPRWNQDRPRQFLFIDSALQRFRRYEGVNELLEALLALLTSNPEPTFDTRTKRERIERALGQSLAAFGLASRQLFQAGWSRDADCRLPLCERIWLDPERTDLPLREEEGVRQEDEDFIAAFEWKDWPDEVAHRFGNWLNAILLQHKLPVGDAEHAHWARQALIDAEWPAPMQRRARPTGVEVTHG
ncbi:type I-F CRISPR-associated protein Csy1 [Stutzerimonas kirkiae]|uniref:type I-F CRISPR-associated protein Csy1 n=1 Tax=Stutzerimonas kirkiae TaxID=2211392 RepID=UPI0010383FCC|nr:type I-F CRISPR-associated protein Csy1 [Stutzerimonas kirkiae]TBV11858.1 type I-F CRISPR-associated protein Csy1 [Stutzerimonas kirkiae]